MILYNPAWQERNPWPHLFTDVLLTSLRQLSKGGCLILWGGEDIAPCLYGEVPNVYTFTYEPSLRDIYESKLIDRAINAGIPIIGICRGAQLLCAKAGGTLAQHITNHNRLHSVCLFDEEFENVMCNSSHHQMMLPPASAKILAAGGGGTYVTQWNTEKEYEQSPEVVWFPSINALGIQPHPEWENSPKEFNEYIERKIKEYIL